VLVEVTICVVVEVIGVVAVELVEVIGVVAVELVEVIGVVAVELVWLKLLLVLVRIVLVIGTEVVAEKVEVDVWPERSSSTRLAL